VSHPDEEALHYFGIGHGDFNEELGSAPSYQVWAYLGGKIQTGPIARGDVLELDEEDDNFPYAGTHGSLWGDVTKYTYRGRYEPDTGRLSIVKPENREQEDVPSRVMLALRNSFNHISEVHIF
jgi:hypothetical protein